MPNYSADNETRALPQMCLLDRLARAIEPLVATRQVYFIALLGLCAAYIQGGVTKLLDFSAAVAETQRFGLPFAAAATGATIVTEFAGSALILTGVYWWLGDLIVRVRFMNSTRGRDNMPGRFGVGVLIKLTIVAHIFGGSPSPGATT
jgi:hypothetical protein